MRLLVTIPHFCRRAQQPSGFYGSETTGIEVRRDQVARCITALHQTFGPRQTIAAEQRTQANDVLKADKLDVVLVTTGNQHLADELPRHLFLQVATTVEPRHLGFACHEIMREYAGQYDYFVYLEDDLELVDSLFFAKLAWFNITFGHSALLQPNRFETAGDLDVMKFYIDGNTTQPELSARYQSIGVRTKLLGEAFGRSFLFRRIDNAHAGCFFLNAAQLSRVAASPKFGKPTAEFFGPLESAATLTIMQAFEVYKPARENAGFLEVHHLGRRFLGLPPPGAASPPMPDAAPSSEPDEARSPEPDAPPSS